METILFQGDSITDAGRLSGDPTGLGYGYPAFVAGKLGLQEAGTYTFYNRGVSGNRVVDIYARIKADIINLNPSVLSILVGVNDVWHEAACNDGVAMPKFKRVYAMLLEEILEEIPNIKIMLLEPFVLKGTETAGNLDWFQREVRARAIAVKELAEEYHLKFIPLQDEINKLTEKAPPEYWLYDGVHPTPSCHQFLADTWLEAYRSL